MRLFSRNANAVLLFTAMLFSSTQAQETSAEGSEELISMHDDDERVQSLSPLMEEMEKKRFPINKVNAAELASLQLLTPLQITQFIRFRETFGDFISLMELQAIPYWTTETARSVIPYLSFKEQSTVRIKHLHPLREGDHRLLYRTGGGSAMKSMPFSYNQLISYRFNHGNQLTWGATTKKDAGERNPFDHLSGYAGIKRSGRINSLILGDFTVAMGQGLIHWQGYAMGRSGNLVQAYRQSALFKPHTGTDENLFHRGMALDLQHGKWSTAVFFSNKKIANGKQRLTHFALGGRITYSNGKGKTSINLISHRFDQPIEKQERVYNHYALRDPHWQNLSIDHAWTLRGGFLFGEYAIDKQLNTAFLSGILKSLHPKLDVSLVIRSLASAYRGFTTNAITQNQDASNERGIFGCINFTPSTAHRMACYLDRFTNPWPVYGCDLPRQGLIHAAQYEWRPSKKTSLTLRYVQSSITSNGAAADNKNASIDRPTHRRLRIHASTAINTQFTLRYRAEWAVIENDRNDKEKGGLVYAELIFAPPLSRISLSARSTMYHTGGYESRIYAYERDLPFYHSIPAAYGEGVGHYLLFNCALSRQLRWSIKGVWTSKSNAGDALVEQHAIDRFQWRTQLIWYPQKG